MRIGNQNGSWGVVSRTFHWAIALLVFGMVPLGWWMTGLEDLGQKFAVYQWHKSFGLTVLTLAVLRLLWRLANGAPRFPPGLARWERIGAHAAHVALYLLILAIPLSGWLMVSAATLQVPTAMFGVIPVPHLLAPDADLSAAFKQVHETLVWVLLAVVAAHVAGALKHHFLDRNEILVRMLRGNAQPRLNAASSRSTA